MDHVPEIVARYLAAYNALDVEGMLTCLSKDIKFVNVSSGNVTAETRGIEAFNELAKQGVSAFLERHQSVTNCIAAGDRVALRIAYRAVVRSDLPNGWKAGQSVETEGTSFIKLLNGRIDDLVDIS